MIIPTTAFAHLIFTGMGPVYDGVGHLLLTPEDLVPLVGLSLYSGLRGTSASRLTIFTLPIAWLIGGVIGLNVSYAIWSYAPHASFIILGALTASDLPLPNIFLLSVSVLTGAVLGYANGVALNTSSGLLNLFGITVALFIISTLITGFVVTLKRSWTRIAVRALGGWIVALGILMLGWTLKGL